MEVQGDATAASDPLDLQSYAILAEANLPHTVAARRTIGAVLLPARQDLRQPAHRPGAPRRP